MTRHANLELRTYNFKPTTDREMTSDLAFGRRIELSRNLRNKTVHLSVVFSRDDARTQQMGDISAVRYVLVQGRTAGAWT
jgi:hypothetical protein